jgi:ABC-2 type transport system permease protein
LKTCIYKQQKALMSNWIGFYSFLRREVERFIRVALQSFATPLISATLYILIFGRIVGSRVGSVQGVDYIDFVLPGILMMNVIMAAFGQSSNSLYFQRFVRHIEEILVSPLSYGEMIAGYITGALARAITIAVGIYVIGILFGGANFEHIGAFFFYVIAVSILFGFLGLLVGLWANGFELTIWNSFIITPLSYLGGMFYSTTMLPVWLQKIIVFNPFFYFIDGVRYSMIGVREAHAGIGVAVILVSLVVLGGLVWYLFRTGYRLRS